MKQLPSFFPAVVRFIDDDTKKMILDYFQANRHKGFIAVSRELIELKPNLSYSSKASSSKRYYLERLKSDELYRKDPHLIAFKKTYDEFISKQNHAESNNHHIQFAKICGHLTGVLCHRTQIIYRDVLQMYARKYKIQMLWRMWQIFIKTQSTS